MKDERIIVVGAGVSGLTFARRAARAGARVTVLDKGRGVGGRCATRRVAGQPVDHGVPTIHGRSDALRRLLEGLRASGSCTPVPDWPFRLRGAGTPCRPAGYEARSFRLAIAEGQTALAKHLAEGLDDLRLETEVEGIEIDEAGRRVAVTLVGGETLEASSLVVTCPLPQAAALLKPLAPRSRELAGVLGLIETQLFMLPCLTVVALYDRPSATAWHLLLPGAESPIHSLINDSSKREELASTGTEVRQALVIQAGPRFSRERIEQDPESWTQALLAAAAAELGDWAASPAEVQSHRWRFARLQLGCELTRPVLLGWPGGARLALCGEAFDRAGGVEAAYLSALALVERISAGDATPADASSVV